MKNKKPKHYSDTAEKYPGFIQSVEKMGEEIRKAGPLDEKTIQLIQIGASVTAKSEGAVHSHVRRALEFGVKADEIRHAVIVLTATIGFPLTMAGLSWVNDILD